MARMPLRSARAGRATPRPPPPTRGQSPPVPEWWRYWWGYRSNPSSLQGFRGLSAPLQSAGRGFESGRRLSGVFSGGWSCPSSPSTLTPLSRKCRVGALGACRSGQTGQTVNLLAKAYGGSSPSAPTCVRPLSPDRGFSRAGRGCQPATPRSARESLRVFRSEQPV